jgi:hypothetical protein
MWSFSISTKEEPPSWGSISIGQVKLEKVIEGNIEEDQTTTPTTHKTTYSKGDSS